MNSRRTISPAMRATLGFACLFLFTFITGCHTQKRTLSGSESSTQPSAPIHVTRNDQWQRERIRRLRIKTQVQTRYPYRFGEPLLSAGVRSLVTNFDTLGRVSEIVYYSKNVYPSGNIPLYSYRRYYDPKGHLSVKKTFNLEPPAELLFTNLCAEQYDSTGVLLERDYTEVMWDGNIPVGKEVFAYDSLGDCVSDITYSAPQTGTGITLKSIFDYDSAGRLAASFDEKYWRANIMAVAPNGPRIVAAKSTYSYDNNDNVIERIEYDANDDPIFYVKYTYTYFK